jgi:hypothetical protein
MVLFRRLEQILGGIESRSRRSSLNRFLGLHKEKQCLSPGHEDRPETDQDYADPEVSLHFLPQKQPRSERKQHSI